MPSSHRLRLYGGRWTWPRGFSSSSICDLRCMVRPTDCAADDNMPTTIPTAIVVPFAPSMDATEKRMRRAVESSEKRWIATRGGQQ